MLVEVTSESSEAYDRGAKFDHYREISSLEEYVLVSHREPLVEVFRRGADGEEWTRVEDRTRASVRLESLGASLEIDTLYSGIDLRPNR